MNSPFAHFAVGCGAAEAIDLAYAFFVLLLSTLLCYQPTELIWAFFLFYLFSTFTPPPLIVMYITIFALHNDFFLRFSLKNAHIFWTALARVALFLFRFGKLLTIHQASRGVSLHSHALL